MSCAACFIGAPHTGFPKGVYTTLHGFKTYIIEPDQPHLREALFCCTVIFPDIVRNGGVDPSWMPVFKLVLGGDPAPWYMRLWAYVQIIALLPQMFLGMPEQRFAEVLQYARAIRAGLPMGAKLGVAGFCWGGYGSTHLCKEMAVEGGEERLLDAHFAGHPSKLDTPKHILGAVESGVPYAVAVAEIDFMFDEKKALETEAELRQMYGESGKNKATWELKIYKGAHHGFCVRAEEGVEADEEACVAALEQAVEWFKRYLL